MKKYFGLLALSLLLVFSSCTKKVTVVNKGVPPGQVKKQTAPGQVKKRTGSQSAAPYAPGQQKKAAAAPSKSSSNSNASGNSKSNGNGNGGKKK